MGTEAQLHCGACLENFDNVEELSNHLDSCAAANTLRYFVLQTFFNSSLPPGHALAHFIKCLQMSAYTIKRYIDCIAQDEYTNRAEIHYKLCKELGLDYNGFKPFESEDIVTIPSKQEAETILWEAFRKELVKLL